jgi:cadmium resistance protein CadD (predicted permease)
MPNWVEVRSFSNNIEAEIAKSALEGAGIKSQIQIDDIVGGLFGLYPGMLAIRLLVHKERVNDAKKILQALKP